MQGCAHSPSGHRSPSRTFGKRRWRYPYDEGVDEPGKLIEIESVEVEAEVPAEENEPVERIEKPDKPEKPAFEEDEPSRRSRRSSVDGVIAPPAEQSQLRVSASRRSTRNPQGRLALLPALNRGVGFSTFASGEQRAIASITSSSEVWRKSE